jgi:hypothetical protein
MTLVVPDGRAYPAISAHGSRKPMRRRRFSTQELRLTIDCLPLRTRIAMLEGVRSNDIIVGAYVDRAGGVCPMLAAHRCGGRTSFISFAKAWDGFTGAKRARRASERELRVLTAELEASIMAEEQLDLGEAIADHARLRRDDTTKRRAGDPDRSAELRTREGWSWLRPFRRLDDYERAMARVGEQTPKERERERV